MKSRRSNWIAHPIQRDTGRESAGGNTRELRTEATLWHDFGSTPAGPTLGGSAIGAVITAAPGYAGAPWLGLGALVLAILAGGALAWLRPWADPDVVWREGERPSSGPAGSIGPRPLPTSRPDPPATPLDLMLRAQVDIARDRIDTAVAALDEVPDDHPVGAQARLMAG